MRSAVVLLWDLIDWEVADINVGRKFWFERGSNLS